ncbi:DNA translocase FtsK [Patulibacter sp. SYSU D01012]|uniref:FtsK/SpoIIIE family DNA translocase n=1 Tax=Patulibacter sp. SYSU D01012 TaxID=2817381 RepID=UPI001B315B22|nr:DNA translocase FtsK [Patulibacter sp. SYSU D01012]
MSSRTRTPARSAPSPKAPKGGKGASPRGAAPGGKGGAGAFSPRGPLEQRQFDQIGLGLVALAVFLVFLMYLGSWGGAVGDALVDGLRTLFGQVAYLTPPLVAATGLMLILRPLLPALRPFRLGGVLLVLAMLLMLASGTFGLGGGGGRDALWSADVVRPRGGVLGDAMYWAISSLLGAIGAHVVGVTMLLAGVLLLTGASIASLVARTGEGLKQTTTAFRRQPGPDDDVLEIPVAPRRRAAARPATAEEDAVPARRRPTPPKAADGDDDADEAEAPEFALPPRRRRPAGPPEPTTGEEIAASRGDEVVASRGEGVRASRGPGRPTPELDGALRYPDLFGEDGPARLDLPTPAPATRAGGAAAPPAGATPPPSDAGHVPPPEEPAGDHPFDDTTGEPTVEPPTVVTPPARASRPPAPADEAPDGDADERPSLQELRERQPMPGEHDAPEEGYVLPDPAVLKHSAPDQLRPDTAGQAETAAALVEALANFKVDAQVIGTIAGPHITRYELRLAPGIKMSKVAQLKDDLAYALAATDIRILAPVPGKTAVGVEVPNKRRRIVHLGDVYGDPPGDASPLTVWLGKDVSGAPVYADLAKMPHMLVAGTTGAGKSGCVNAMLSSILLHATPDDVRLVLVDPKQVELNHYEAVPHLLTPVITSPKMAANALQNLVREMEWRYGVMSVKKTRNLPELNRVRVEEGDEPLPYVLCVIDELADLMMVAPADVEDAIIRIAQKARAVGIHLVLATQSPRVDVITGMIKANVPSRIAFSVSSQTDSRVILDQNGAESLLGRGDMLFNPVGSSKLTRIQGAYIDESEIAALTEHWARQGEPDLREDLLEATDDEEPQDDGDGDGMDADEDPLLADAIELVVEMGAASTSGLQRRLRVGYTRAGRLVDMMERRGIVSGFEGSKARQVLVSPMDLPRILQALRGGGGSDGAGDPAADAAAAPEAPHAPPTGDDTDDRTGEHAAIGSGGE